ncbi:hypothetical protein [Burkholderia sp. Ac-20379]|uniref:hypothetical protein n=1 Tax=Burkholderia sp. Ac-20379 TaxID=2703900 RepID=UPI00197EDB5C|nr:hypothetical protein [Burkholderia sp. Ac-20379]MBN3728540.1 hypothetical protein [Burkholderia sp. Ac-20379]
MQHRHDDEHASAPRPPRAARWWPMAGVALALLAGTLTLHADSSPSPGFGGDAFADAYGPLPARPGDIAEALRLSSTALCH